MISLVSMFGSLGAGVGQTGLGALTRARSIANGYVVGGAATILVLPLLLSLRRMGERADAIVGEGCGSPAAPCAAQGLVDASLVDARPRRAA